MESIEYCEEEDAIDFQQVLVDTTEPVLRSTGVETVNEPNSWEYLISQYDWDLRTARAVLLAESEGNPNAVNWNDHHGSCISSRGLFQVGCFWAEHFGYTVEDLYVPSVNVEIAYRIWKEQGWQPWGVIHDGRYLQYLD